MSSQSHVQVWYLAYDEEGNGTGTNLHPTEFAAYTDLVSRVFNVIGYNENQVKCDHVPSKTAVLQTVCSKCDATIFNHPAGSENWVTENENFTYVDDDAKARAKLIQSANDALEARVYRSLWFTIDELLASDNRNTFVVGDQWLPMSELTTGQFSMSRQFYASSSFWNPTTQKTDLANTRSNRRFPCSFQLSAM